MRDVDALIQTKYANSGDVGLGGLDLNELWPVTYSTPGGSFPQRQQFNQLFRYLSALAVEINQKGPFLEYNDTIDYAIGVAAKGSDGNEYKSFVANGPSTNVVDPVGDITGTWQATLTLSKALLLQLRRAHFDYDSVSDIDITGGVYPHFVTRDQLLHIDSAISYSKSTFGNDQWVFYYLNDSAIAISDTTLVTSAEITDSLTVPTYNQVKKGWYNGNDLCIFVTWVNSFDEIVPFYHANDIVFYDEEEIVYSASPVSGAWTTVTATDAVPDFVDKVQITITGSAVGGGSLFWRAFESVGSGHFILSFDANVSTLDIRLDSLKQFQIRATGTSPNVTVRFNGWYFPKDM